MLFHSVPSTWLGSLLYFIFLRYCICCVLLFFLTFLFVVRLFKLFFTCLFCVFPFHSFFLCMLVSGLLFLLWSAIPSVPAAWLYFLLWHLLIYWSGERQAIGGWHRVAMAAHLQHLDTLENRFVTRRPSLCPITCTSVGQSLPQPFYPQYLPFILVLLPCKMSFFLLVSTEMFFKSSPIDYLCPWA